AATDEAAAAAEGAADAVTSPADLLTVDGFDLDKVQDMIDGSELGALQKTGLTTALNSVKDNPDLLESVLTQIKEAMGL
ncbi:MAG: hypothetical protein AAFP98_00815, partial [Pseudomonadota bacterium]